MQKLPDWNGTGAVPAVDGCLPEVIEVPAVGNGYNYEAAEVARCLRSDRLESDVMPLDETIATLRALDEARRQFGLRYPGEET